MTLGGGVDYEGEVSLGKGEGGDVGFEDVQRRVIRQVGEFLGEGFGVAGDQCRVYSDVGPDQAFQEPGAYEAGSSGDEDRGVAQSGPDVLGVLEDVVEVGG